MVFLYSVVSVVSLLALQDNYGLSLMAVGTVVGKVFIYYYQLGMFHVNVRSSYVPYDAYLEGTIIIIP